MKYFSPSYWLKLWVLSAPLFNYKNEGIYAKSIDNQNIKDWASNNTNLDLIENKTINLFNNQTIQFQNHENIPSSPNLETDDFYEKFLKTQGWSNNPEMAQQQLIEIQEEHHNFLKQEHRKKREKSHSYTPKFVNENNDDVDIFEIRYSYFGSLNRIYSPNFLTSSSFVFFTSTVTENGLNFFYDFNFLTILEGILRNNGVISIDLIQDSDNVYINAPLHSQVSSFNFNFYRANNPNQRYQQYREFQMALYSIFISRQSEILRGRVTSNPFNNIFFINDFANQLISRLNRNNVNHQRLISNLNICFFPMPPSRNDILSSLGLNNNIFNHNIRNRITSVINHMSIEFERQFSWYLHFFVSVNLNQRLPFIFQSTLRNLVRRNVRRTRTDPTNERIRVVELFYPVSIPNGVQYDNLNYFIITDVTNVNNNDFHNVYYRVYNPADQCYYHLLASDILNVNNLGGYQNDFFFTVPGYFNLNDYRIRNDNINLENLGESVQTMNNFLLLRTDFSIWISIAIDQLRISIENNIDLENINFLEWQRTCRNTNRNRRNINFNNYNKEKLCKLKNSIPWKEYILDKHNEIYNIFSISKENKIIRTNQGIFIGNPQENIWTKIENKEELKYKNIFLNKNYETYWQKNDIFLGTDQGADLHSRKERVLDKVNDLNINVQNFEVNSNSAYAINQQCQPLDLNLLDGKNNYNPSYKIDNEKDLKVEFDKWGSNNVLRIYISYDNVMHMIHSFLYNMKNDFVNYLLHDYLNKLLKDSALFNENERKNIVEAIWNNFSDFHEKSFNINDSQRLAFQIDGEGNWSENHMWLEDINPKRVVVEKYKNCNFKPAYENEKDDNQLQIIGQVLHSNEVMFRISNYNIHQMFKSFIYNLKNDFVNNFIDGFLKKLSIKKVGSFLNRDYFYDDYYQGLANTIWNNFGDFHERALLVKPDQAIYFDMFALSDSLDGSLSIVKDHIHRYNRFCHNELRSSDEEICNSRSSLIINSKDQLLKSTKIYDDYIHEPHDLKKRELFEEKNITKWNDDFTNSINYEQHLPINNKTNFVSSNITSL